MKIVLIGSMYPPYAIGGAEKAIAMLAEALVRNGHSVVVATLHPGSLEATEESNGIRVYRLPLDNVYWPFTRLAKANPLLRVAFHLYEMWNWKAARRIGRILDLENPDVVHTHNIGGFSVAIWRAVKLRRIRLVHTLHDYYLLCPRRTLYRSGKSCENRCLSCQLFTATRKAASCIPDEVVSVSQFTLDKHRSFGYLRNSASRVIYNVHSTSEEGTRAFIPRSDPGVLTFGFIGRIEPEKGLETLLLATRKLAQPGWRLTIAGKGTDAYVSYLRLKYTDERIRWLGFSSTSEFYPGVDVVVIPSQWSEPLGYVCVESLYAGRPLICARVGGLPEIARLSKVVEYFQPGSVEELTHLMNDALNNQRKWKDTMPNTRSALEGFTEPAVVAKYLCAYRCESEAACTGAEHPTHYQGLLR
jgi:glycosyltransferase involved in cell wall biosynthesis